MSLGKEALLGEVGLEQLCACYFLFRASGQFPSALPVSGGFLEIVTDDVAARFFGGRGGGERSGSANVTVCTIGSVAALMGVVVLGAAAAPGSSLAVDGPLPSTTFSAAVELS